MSHFTCISCQTLFKDFDTQKLHYKSDWHRYNLKRKIAEFPPVSAEEFQQLVVRQRAINTADNTAVKAFCSVCRSSFSNSKSYENHLNSKKHLFKVANNPQTEPIQDQPTVECEELFEEDLDSEEWEEDVENPIDDNNCLFCNHHNASMNKNLKHMAEAHTFFIPDIEYCIDVYGLLKYLGDKITKGYVCLWCNETGKTFFSVDSVRRHMMDKGHTKMLHEGVALAEYVEFYDYSTSYPADQQDREEEEEVKIEEIDGSDYQLVLPSGATIGHRSLMRYYKQSIDPNRPIVKANKLHKVLAGYKALGWSATQQEVAAKKARDLHYMKRVQAKWNMKLSVKANKLQTHFRQQVNF